MKHKHALRNTPTAVCTRACVCVRVSARARVCVCHYEQKIAVVVLVVSSRPCCAVAIHPDHAVGKGSLCCHQ